MIGMGFTHGAAEPWPPQVTHVRLWDNGVAWCQVHTGPGVFDWTLLDALVAKAEGRHLTYVIAGTPRWLARDPDSPHAAPWLGPGSNSMPWSMTHAAAFCSALATRYRGRIHAYEVWNEPQLADFLTPLADVTVLATMTRRAYTAIKAADPGALVLAAAILPRPSSGGMRRAMKYLAALRAERWPVDGFTAHLYPEVGRGVARWRWMLVTTRAALLAARAPVRRLWVTETAYGLLGPTVTDAAALADATYKAAGRTPIWWYAWNRPDLGGGIVGPGSAAWQGSAHLGHAI